MTEQSSTYLRLPLAASTSSVFRKDAFSGLNAYEKHIRFVNEYTKFYDKSSASAQQKPPQPSISEVDILKRNHKFLRDEGDDVVQPGDSNDTTATWEQRIAKKYYDKLFKEFAITNLERHKEGKVALRWRTKKEVVSGIGQFTCANMKCSHRAPYMPPSTVSHFPPNYKHSHQPNLKSWEVNFAYKEGGTHKNALVKIRLCPECSYMLNYKKMKEKEELAALEAEKRRKRKEKKRKRKEREEEGDGQDDMEGKRKSKLNKRFSDSKSDSEDDGNTDQDSENDAKEMDKSESEKPVPVESLAAQIWGAPQVLETEKSKDEEMDDFFNDIFS